jgi:hypothetical protein
MENYGRVLNEVARDRSNLSGMCPVRTSFSPFFPLNLPDPTPLPCGKPFFGPYMACNLHGINVMHFRPVDESVTANP